jgi:hypothetical protein
VNPPAAISPDNTYLWRDAGPAGSGPGGLSKLLVSQVARRLRPEGWATLLADWLHPGSGEWSWPVKSWLTGLGCDAWVLRFNSEDPLDYARNWLAQTEHTTRALLRRSSGGLTTTAAKASTPSTPGDHPPPQTRHRRPQLGRRHVDPSHRPSGRADPTRVRTTTAAVAPGRSHALARRGARPRAGRPVWIKFCAATMATTNPPQRSCGWNRA